MSAWSTSEPYVEKFYLFSCSNKDELTVRLLTDLGTAYELRPMLLHPDRTDLTPMEIAQYLCRVSTRVLVSGEKHQRLPKIVVDGVEDYGSSSWRDTGRLLRCWDDGRRSMYNVMKVAGVLDIVEETFANGEQIEVQELIRVIKDLNDRKVFRKDGDSQATTKSVRLSVMSTRITRVVARVGTIDIDDEGYPKKMPEVSCDYVVSRKRKADDDLDEAIVTIQASNTAPIIEVSRKRSWVVPSQDIFDC